MKITFENPEKVNGLMTLTVEEADYKQEVEKTLKDYRKRANIPGFRPGQAPMGLIKRQIGTQVKADAINKVVGENLQKYIVDNKIKMLGQPLGAADHEPVDLDKEAPYVFKFDSIAKVDLISKTADTDIGYKISAKGGEIVDKHEEGAQKGTTITVNELFFNTPVRYKFLKKDFTESGYIEDAITRIALANPSVAIKLINSGKVVIQTNGSGRLEDCIYSIFGKEIYDNVLPVDYQYENYHVSGVIGKPIISRSNRSNQLFFCNNRFVKDKTLTSAAEQGFKGLVTIGKHGFLVLNIDMDPKLVDVNVHPTKLEVRFQEESKLFKAVYHAIKETLLKSDLIADPVKDYSEQTPNDILKGITNKQRVEAWKINKDEAKVDLKDEEKQNIENIESVNEIENKPKFDEFKATITNMDSDKRNQFMEEITKAKTSEEIAEQIDKLTDLIKNNEDVKDSNEKDVEDEKIEINEKNEKNVVLSIEEKEDVKYDFSEEP